MPGDTKGIDAIYKKACSCRTCFTTLGLEQAYINKAQPRWVGPKYWQSELRVLVVLVNPGSGNFRADPGMEASRNLLNWYCNGESSLADYFKYQRVDMERWGRGRRFLNYFENSLGLDIDRTAFINLAWCATGNNRYPNEMLGACFERHGKDLVRALAPSHVLLCGSATHGYQDDVRHVAPTARVFTTLHYAHREGSERESLESMEIRKQLGAV